MARSTTSHIEGPIAGPLAETVGNHTVLDELELLLADTHKNIPYHLLRVLRMQNPNFPSTLKPRGPLHDDLDRKSRLFNQGRALIETARSVPLGELPLRTQQRTVRDLSQILLDLRDLEVYPPLPKKQSDTTTQPGIKNKRYVVAHAAAIVASIEEALDFDSKRHHNNPPPALRVENDAYLSCLRELVVELRTLITLLEEHRPSRAKAAKTTISLANTTQKFIDNYVPLLAKGTAALTVAAFAGLLIQLGVDAPIVEKILAAARLLR